MPPATDTASRARLLVVDDDADLRASLDDMLSQAGFEVVQAADGAQMRAALAEGEPALVLLDLRLKGEDGLTLARGLRAQSAVPLIMISGQSDETDRVLLLELAADDFLVKPFSARELVARVRAVLRRTAAPKTAPQRLQVGRLTIEPEMVRAAIGASALPLTATEFRLLAALAETPGRVFARSELIERCMPDSDAIERTVDSHLRNVRRKLGQAGAGEMLETVRGIGYRLVAPG